MTYYITTYPSWNIDIGNAYIVNDGRAKVEVRFPDGSWTLEEFVEMVRRATEGWEDVTINWSEDTGGGEASFWVIALRQPTAEDLANIEDWKRRTAERHRSERAWHDERIAELEGGEAS